MKALRILILSFVAVITSFGVNGQIAGLDGNPRIKVMSFNIRHSGGDDGDNSWAHRKEAVLEMIRSTNPDLIGLQEVLPDQFAFLKENFPAYQIYGLGRDGDNKGERMAIMVKNERFHMIACNTFWLSETPQWVSRGWDAACNRTVTWAYLRDNSSGKYIGFYNTHFDHEGEIARRESAKLLVKYIKKHSKKTPVIITGDFNATPDDPILRPIGKKFSSARDKAPWTDRKGTFNGWRIGEHNNIIDHIYYKGLSPISYHTLTEGFGGRPFVSDHYPVVVLFEP